MRCLNKGICSKVLTTVKIGLNSCVIAIILQLLVSLAQQLYLCLLGQLAGIHVLLRSFNFLNKLIQFCTAQLTGIVTYQISQTADFLLITVYYLLQRDRIRSIGIKRNLKYWSDVITFFGWQRNNKSIHIHRKVHISMT